LRVARLIRIIEAVTDLISGRLQGWVLLAMMVLVLVDVTTRYLLLNPLSVAEEYGGYMLVAITCLGLAFAWKERSHVRVEFLVAKLPSKLRRGLRLFTLSLAFVFSLVMILASWELVSFSFIFGTRSGSWLRTPVAWPQITIIIGSVLLFLQLLVELLRALTGRGDESGEA
jgi:TRAP-type C4-dicarboxylate transport system permease small subunit